MKNAQPCICYFILFSFILFYEFMYLFAGLLID
jgi:hypothetical protein